MALNPKQFKFTQYVSMLIQYAYSQGYTLSFGDAWAKTGHTDNSKHYDRLAIDFNLFKDGQLLTKTHEYRFLGDYWECLDIKCTWGGKWNDGCHFSWDEYDRS